MRTEDAKGKALTEGAHAKGMPSSRLENKQENLLMWESYAARWDPTLVTPEDPGRTSGPTGIKVLGEEWGTLASLERVLRDFIFPFIRSDSTVADYGSGGGRLAGRVAPHVKHLICCDISAAMLARCAETLNGYSNVSFVNIINPLALSPYRRQLDFVFAFDVFVHMDLHTMRETLLQIRDVLKSDGRVLIHTANLMTTLGWARFTHQSTYSPGGFYFVTPEIVNHLLEKTGFEIVRRSSENPDDFYLGRDYLVIGGMKCS